MVTRIESETSSVYTFLWYAKETSSIYTFLWYANRPDCEIFLRKYLHDQQETRQHLWPVELREVRKLEK